MKRFTPSAQRTLALERPIILQKLEAALMEDESLQFISVGGRYIKEAKLKDGSKLVIGAFERGNGKTLAMIDHQNLPVERSRAHVQQALKQKLKDLF